MDKVTIELVGKENYMTDPLCRNAVYAGLSIKEFVQLLIEDRKHLQEVLLGKYLR